MWRTCWSNKTPVLCRRWWSIWSRQEERPGPDHRPPPAAGQGVPADCGGCRPAGQPQCPCCGLRGCRSQAATVLKRLLYYCNTRKHPWGTAVSSHTHRNPLFTQMSSLEISLEAVYTHERLTQLCTHVSLRPVFLPQTWLISTQMSINFTVHMCLKRWIHHTYLMGTHNISFLSVAVRAHLCVLQTTTIDFSSISTTHWAMSIIICIGWVTALPSCIDLHTHTWTHLHYV